MRLSKGIYPVLIALVFGLCSLSHALADSPRIAGDLQHVFFFSKVIFAGLGFVMAAVLYQNGLTDLSGTIFMVILASYCLFYMWLAPLYEAAYLQCALATSFFSLRRQWIYPAIWGGGLLGIFATYAAQDRLGWTLPPIARSDWYWIVSIFFLLGWFIHKYAIGAYRKEQDRLLRFGVIGKETTRLTHDLKGLLSSPLMMIETLRDQGQKLAPEVLERQLLLLASDMENVREVLRSIHRLVNVDEMRVSVDVLPPVQSAMKVLERRLHGVCVSLPENKTVHGNADRMHSIFFNLFLNSIEAFEGKKHQAPEIRILWEDTTLIFKDNARGDGPAPASLRSNKDHGSGLGLELIRADLQEIDADFDIGFQQEWTVVKIHFPMAR